MLFQTLHLGAPMCLWERCCLRSFVDYGHSMVVYGYEELDLPDGVRWAPAQDILSDTERIHFFENAAGAYTRFSNLFRYVLLNEHGGWWVDTDVLCLSERMPQEDVVLGWEDHRSICGAIMRLPAGHPILVEAIEYAWDCRNVDVWGYIGPQLLTRLVREHELTHVVNAPWVLYPVHYSAALDLIDPGSRDVIAQVLDGAPFLHFWHSIFRRAGFQTDVPPPDGSYLAEVFARHGGACVHDCSGQKPLS
jgi:hypothetical protein